METIPPPGVTVPLAFTPAEAGKQLRVSERTVDDLIRAGKLAAVRVGRHRRITPAAIVDFLAANPWRASA